MSRVSIRQLFGNRACALASAEASHSSKDVAALKTMGNSLGKDAAAAKLAKTLRTRIPAEGTPAHEAFNDLALVAWLIPAIPSWTAEEKDLLRQTISAKAACDEMTYLHLLQKHGSLRREMLRLGSAS